MIVDKFKKIQIDNDDLSKYVEEYLNSSSYSHASIKAKKYALTIFLSYHSTKQSFFFQVEDLTKYRRHLEYKLGKSKLTVRNYLSTLNLFFTYLIDKNILEKNPLKRIKYAIKTEKKELKYFTLNEINNYLNNYSNLFLELRSRIVFLLSISTNLTIEELSIIKRIAFVKKERSYILTFNDISYSIDNQYNKLIKAYLDSIHHSKNEYLLIKETNDGYEELKSRTLRDIVVKIIKAIGDGGQPLITLRNTSIMYYYYKTNSLKKLEERYNIKTKEVIDRYKREKDHFRSN